ncbi:hypothetical protein [Miltoncostaea oceani]|uniref:hypothetical protein n=1 Tax=Miltoncostaea oceani TaxID=2843216 RepID=UPI001C3E1266|nr:hypothetical protein [Miltoncostaea oceani]
MPIDNELTVRWGGVDYRQSQLTAADMIAMEEEWGEAFVRIDFESMKAVCWLVWLIRRHEEPDLSLDDVTSITLDALSEDAKAAAVPPTSGSRKRASKSGKSGGRTTARSSGSGPGTSSS